MLCSMENIMDYREQKILAAISDPAIRILFRQLCEDNKKIADSLRELILKSTQEQKEEPKA